MLCTQQAFDGTGTGPDRQHRLPNWRASAYGPVSIGVTAGPLGRSRMRGTGNILTCAASPITLFVMSELTSALAVLSAQQRLELIEWLWDSLEDKDISVTSAQRAELDKRIASFDRDLESAVAWEQLKSQLRRQR